MTTELEHQMLANIARNEMTPLNGAEPDTVADCICYADCLENGPYNLTVRQISGLMSQLTQKGLVVTDGENVSLTPAGFAAYRSRTMNDYCNRRNP